MIITPLRVSLIPSVEHLIGLGAPFIWPRTSSDYWLYAELFSSTCTVAIENDEVIGVVNAFRSQDRPADVISHPNHRRRDITRSLLDAVHQQATAWGCHRLYLTSEPHQHCGARHLVGPRVHKYSRR